MENTVRQAIRKMKQVAFLYANSSEEEQEEIMKLFSMIEERYESENGFIRVEEGNCSCPQESGRIIFKNNVYCLDCLKRIDIDKAHKEEKENGTQNNTQDASWKQGS